MKAAEAGFAPEAQHELGAAYETGEGVEKDEVEAARWYRMAAEQGYRPSRAALGVMCLQDREEGLTAGGCGGEGAADPEIEEMLEEYDAEEEG